MLKITHICGYERDFQFNCPKCGLPFCEEDTEQAMGGALLGHIKNYDKISSLDIYVNGAMKSKINEIIDWCNNHKKPHDAEILPL